MERLAVSALAALLAGASFAASTLASTPTSAIVLPSGMTLGGQVEPASPTASVTSVSISAQDGETGVAAVSTSGGKTFYSFHFKVAGPGTVTWRVTTNSGAFSGSVATGKVKLSKTGGMVREWNLCAKSCSEPVAQPMGR